MSIDKQTQHILDAVQAVDPTLEAVLKIIEVDFDDAKYEAFDNLLGVPIERFLSIYLGGNGFLNTVKSRVIKGRITSSKQRRAVANICRRALRGESLSGQHGYVASPPDEAPKPHPNDVGSPFKEGQVVTAVEADEARNTHGITSEKCYKCNNFVIGSYQFLMNEHKPNCGNTAWPGLTTNQSWADNGSKNTHNIERSQPKFMLDLRTLPVDGRYAIKDGAGGHKFYLIKVLKRRSKLTGRFNWSKYPSYRHQTVEAGAILVREQSGDTKQMIGNQLISDGFYYGEQEEAIKEIMADPSSAMVLYGKILKKCGYCGRSLTDAESLARGIGPDCFQEKHIPRIIQAGQRAYDALGVSP